MNDSSFLDRSKRARTDLDLETPQDDELEEPAYLRRTAALQPGEWVRPDTFSFDEGIIGSPREKQPQQQPQSQQTIPTFVWTKQSPTEPGWYWNRPRHAIERATMVLVVNLPNTSRLFTLDPVSRSFRMVVTMPDDWAGPIPEPQ